MIERPTVGRLVVPFMVDATRDPIDFKALDEDHIRQCAEDGRCGICGGRIRRGPIAFIGPTDGRTCFADPWMHDECADLALEQCPFLLGKRGFKGGSGAMTEVYEQGMGKVLADNWRAHRGPAGEWHFEALAIRRG